MQRRLNMLTDNWIYDLYTRIDAERLITGNLARAYTEEINWSFRLGYLSEPEREALMQYLKITQDEKQKAFDHAHAVHMAQIQYEQAQLQAYEDFKDEIRELFKLIAYNNSTRKYYYAVDKDFKGLETGE